MRTRCNIKKKQQTKKFQENFGLKHLNLSMNGLGDRGAKAIGNGLKYNQCLKELNISCNRLSPDGAQEVAKGLAANEKLETLWVSLYAYMDFLYGSALLA